MRIRQRWIRIVMTTVFGIIAVTSVYPLFWLLLNSFKDTNEIMTGESFGLPSFWKIENYTDAIFNRDIIKYFLNSVFITGLTLILTTVTAIMLSYALVRMKWKLSHKVSKMVTLGILLPSQIVIVPIFMMLRELNLINNPLSLVLTISAFNIPMAVIMCSSFLSSIPYEMEEAAVMDGAGIFSILFTAPFPFSDACNIPQKVNRSIKSENIFSSILIIYRNII